MKTKSKSQRMTRQRKVILDILIRDRSHPTADEIYQQAKVRLPRISLGTVYRNLELLVASGLAKKLDLGSGQKRFDSRTETHYHLRCLVCGRITDLWLDESTIRNLEAQIWARSGFLVTEHSLDFEGICRCCGWEENRKKEDM